MKQNSLPIILIILFLIPRTSTGQTPVEILPTFETEKYVYSYQPDLYYKMYLNVSGNLRYTGFTGSPKQAYLGFGHSTKYVGYTVAINGFFLGLERNISAAGAITANVLLSPRREGSIRLSLGGGFLNNYFNKDDVLSENPDYQLGMAENILPTLNTSILYQDVAIAAGLQVDYIFATPQSKHALNRNTSTTNIYSFASYTFHLDLSNTLIPKINYIYNGALNLHHVDVGLEFRSRYINVVLIQRELQSTTLGISINPFEEFSIGYNFTAPYKNFAVFNAHNISFRIKMLSKPERWRFPKNIKY